MNQDTGVRLVYTTMEGADQAREIGRELITRRLAACVNIIDPMISIFRWDGGIQEGRETVMIAKTRNELVPAVTDAITEMHDYDCPCVIALPVHGGNADFLGWIASETSDPDKGTAGGV